MYVGSSPVFPRVRRAAVLLLSLRSHPAPSLALLVLVVLSLVAAPGLSPRERSDPFRW